MIRRNKLINAGAISHADAYRDWPPPAKPCDIPGCFICKREP